VVEEQKLGLTSEDETKRAGGPGVEVYAGVSVAQWWQSTIWSLCEAVYYQR
jgi:hypothetical protein